HRRGPRGRRRGLPAQVRGARGGAGGGGGAARARLPRRRARRAHVRARRRPRRRRGRLRRPGGRRAGLLPRADGDDPGSQRLRCPHRGDRGPPHSRGDAVVTSPEDALALARERAAAARARGGYANDLSNFAIDPVDAVTLEHLLEWAVVEPDLSELRSTRRHGAPTTFAKRPLYRAL